MVLPPRFTPHPKSAPGDFYVVSGECLACGIPHVIAPDLIAWTGEGVPHCCWKKQPETQAELEQAIAVFEAQELDCHRYAGTDPVILDRILSTYCDYPTASRVDVELGDPQPPQFALLGPRNILARVWRTISGRKG
jgi:hypothetical protein